MRERSSTWQFAWSREGKRNKHGAENEPQAGTLIAQLLEDANVSAERVSARGGNYSIIESTIYEFIHWYDMPWEA